MGRSRRCPPPLHVGQLPWWSGPNWRNCSFCSLKAHQVHIATPTCRCCPSRASWKRCPRWVLAFTWALSNVQQVACQEGVQATLDQGVTHQQGLIGSLG